MPALRELARITAVIIGSTLSLLVIAVFFETAIEMSTAWWELLIGLPIATGLAVVALAIIFASMASTVGVTAIGWLGIFAGRVPTGFGHRDHNLERGLGALAVFAATVALGLALYRLGDTRGELHWALEGLFLVGAGVVFGLAAAVPRLFFASRSQRVAVSRLELPSSMGLRLKGRGRSGPSAQRHAGAEDSSEGKKGEPGENVAFLVTLGMLGVALSMCTVNTVTTLRARDGRATLAYNDWLDGCIEGEQPSEECAADVRLILAPQAQGLLRVEVVGSCPAVLLTAAGEAVHLLTPKELRARSIPLAEAGERTRLVFFAVADTEYRVELEADEDGTCFYSVRYLQQASGAAPTVETKP